MRRILILAMLAAAAGCFGGIVPLTETPVPEFTLPDGTVLTNAYAWRRSAEGIMIMHDGGNYFLNFALLPADWKSVYQPDMAVVAEEQPAETKSAEYDKYKAGQVLKQVPNLTDAARNYLLWNRHAGALDPETLGLALFQSALSGETKESKRFLTQLEEEFPTNTVVKVDELLTPCSACKTTGSVSNPCRACNGTGKCVRCDGQGTRETGMGTAGRIHCTTCRGTGKCVPCQGNGQLVTTCLKCQGRGRVLNREYAEAKIALLVPEVNRRALEAETGTGAYAGLPEGVGPALQGLAGLSAAAKEYYRSERYAGAMDEQILALCVLQSLLAEKSDDVRRFGFMLKERYPKSGRAIVEELIKSCTACEGKGAIAKPCGSCGSSGQCVRCAGKGTRDTGLGGKGQDSKGQGSKGQGDKAPGDKGIYCTTCKGTGKCPACNGAGSITTRCRICDGKGKILDRQRTEIQRDILTAELESFFKQSAAVSP